VSVFDFDEGSVIELRMGKLEQITKSVEALEGDDFKAFAEWFCELQADRWDRQIEADAKAGRLDRLVEEARREIAAGKTRPL
jgi:hypothetical protein